MAIDYIPTVIAFARCSDASTSMVIRCGAALRGCRWLIYHTNSPSCCGRGAVPAGFQLGLSSLTVPLFPFE
jgi:hypothetical protein